MRAKRGSARLRFLVAGVVAVAMVAAACTDDSASSSEADAAADSGNGGNPAEEVAVPIPSGQIDEAIDGLDDIAEEALDKSGVPGMAIAVVHDDDVVYAKGFGVREIGSGEPVDEDTVFQLASVSKPLGATVVASVVGDGTVSWDDPIAPHLPQFVLADPYVTENVTIADLYSHRSGLPNHSGDLLEDLGYDQEEILRRLRFVPLSPFRAEYAYSNFGLTAAGVAVANATGTTWADLSEARIYEPLGMTNTSSRFSDYANAANKAALHVQVGEEWQVSGERDADAQAPAGGASSTATDMGKWLRLVLANGSFDGQQIVDEDAFTEMVTPHSLAAPRERPAPVPACRGSASTSVPI